MKKRYRIWLLAVFLVFLFSACGNRADNEENNQSAHIPTEENTQSMENADGNTKETLEETGGIRVQELTIVAGGRRFAATLYDNETTQAFMERLPMTLNMEELHGNEKFYYLDEELPANPEHIDRIQTGDIMLFGSDCLVLFYDDFSNSYSYTRIGHIEDEAAFADALGDGTVEVTFETGE